MEIRRAKTDDISELAKLTRSVISATHYYSVSARKEEIRKHDVVALRQMLKEPKYYYCFVAMENKKVIGFALGRNEAGVFWGDWVGVSPNYRRKGIAGSLLREWEKTLKKEKVHKIWCDSRTTNKESVRMLEGLGYQKLGLFKNGWYKQDFFLWEKDL